MSSTWFEDLVRDFDDICHCISFKVRDIRSAVHKDDYVVEQKRKYKEPFEGLFEEFKEHLDRLKEEEFLPRYASLTSVSHLKDEFLFINFILDEGNTIFAKHYQIGKYFAVRVLSKHGLLSTHRVKEARNEKKITEAIRFHFIAHMEFTFKDDLNIYFVYPYTSAEDLFTYMQRVNRIPERDAKFYGAQILLALEYLHNMDIVFRNIKPENIIFTANGYVKLSDFQFAKFIDLRTYSFCGTPEYMAPEIILNKGYGKWVDWWAFGVLLFEMIAGYSPFRAEDPMKTFERIIDARLRFTKRFSPLCRNLILNILQKNLSKRYGHLLNDSLDIKCHDWFEIIDWQKVYHQTLHAPYIPEDPMPFIKPPPEKINEIVAIKYTEEEGEYYEYKYELEGEFEYEDEDPFRIF